MHEQSLVPKKRHLDVVGFVFWTLSGMEGRAGKVPQLVPGDDSMLRIWDFLIAV